MITTRSRRRLKDQLRVAFAATMGPLTPQAVDAGMAEPERLDLPLEAWMRRFLPHYTQVEFGKFQRWLCARLDRMTSERASRVNVLAPRGYAKSAIGTLAYALRSALEGTEPYTWIVSKVQGKAEQELANIRREIESNESLARAYPSGCGVGRPWRQGAITLLNGARIEAHAMQEAIRGRREGAQRPSLVICDDVQDNEAMNSADIRAKDRAWFEGALLPAGNTWTNYLNLGTALHRECLSILLTTWPGWESRAWPAIERDPDRLDLWQKWESIYTNGGDPDRKKRAEAYFAANRVEMMRGAVILWPEWESLVTLQKMKLEGQGARAAFEREKQMVPVNPEAREWPDACFEEFIWMAPEERHKFSQAPMRCVALDASKGVKDHGKPGDYSAIVGVAMTDHLLFVKSDLERRSTSKIVHDLFAFCEDFNPDLVGLETNAFQDLFVGEILTMARQFPGMRLSKLLASGRELVRIENRLNKQVRIRGLSRYVTRREFRFERSPSNIILVDQLRDFPDPHSHDDGPDALEMAMRLPFLVQRGSDVANQRLASGV